MKLPKYVDGFIDRTGRPRYYFRRGGKRVPLQGMPRSPDFNEAYDAAMKNFRAPVAGPLGASRTEAGTLNAAIVGYYQSATFKTELAPATQGPQRSLMERFRNEHGDKRLAKLERVHVQAYISKLGSASVQRNMLRAMRHFMRYAKTAGLIEIDPTEGVSRAKMVKTKGFYTWSESDAAKYEARHPIGSQARLAFELYLNLGVRKSDVVRIGPRFIRDGILHNFLPQKGSRTDGKCISIKLFAETEAAIAATPVVGKDTYLVTSFGKAYTANGFGNKMREWCDQAGLPECTSHGLRKLFTIRLVHEGYSAPQIGALTGHKDLRDIQRYIEEYDRQKVGIATSTAFETARSKNKKVPN